MALKINTRTRLDISKVTSLVTTVVNEIRVDSTPGIVTVYGGYKWPIISGIHASKYITFLEVYIRLTYGLLASYAPISETTRKDAIALGVSRSILLSLWNIDMDSLDVGVKTKTLVNHNQKSGELTWIGASTIVGSIPGIARSMDPITDVESRHIEMMVPIVRKALIPVLIGIQHLRTGSNWVIRSKVTSMIFSYTRLIPEISARWMEGSWLCALLTDIVFTGFGYNLVDRISTSVCPIPVTECTLSQVYPMERIQVLDAMSVLDMTLIGYLSINPGLMSSSYTSSVRRLIAVLASGGGAILDDIAEVREIFDNGAGISLLLGVCTRSNEESVVWSKLAAMITLFWAAEYAQGLDLGTIMKKNIAKTLAQGSIVDVDLKWDCSAMA